MKHGISYSRLMLEKISNITNELEIRGIRSVVLNDLAISLYGIIKPVDEIRILVEGKELDTIAYVVAKELGMSIYQRDIYNSLRTLGKAVINPVLIPLTILEITRSPIDTGILVNRIRFTYKELYIYVPQIEYLICKLLTYNAYPYNIYAYALMIVHKEIIDQGVIKRLLKDTNIDLDKIMENISRIKSIIELFPELSNENT